MLTARNKSTPGMWFGNARVETLAGWQETSFPRRIGYITNPRLGSCVGDGCHCVCLSVSLIVVQHKITMAVMKQTQIVEPTVVQTHVPFPVVDVEASKAGGNVVLGKDETDTIVVESASELVTASVKTSLFRTRKGDNNALDMVHDANGRPMIFSVGSDGVSANLSYKPLAVAPAWLRHPSSLPFKTLHREDSVFLTIISISTAFFTSKRQPSRGSSSTSHRQPHQVQLMSRLSTSSRSSRSYTFPPRFVTPPRNQNKSTRFSGRASSSPMPRSVSTARSRASTRRT
jgi:hypothetical protein